VVEKVVTESEKSLTLLMTDIPMLDEDAKLRSCRLYNVRRNDAKSVHWWKAEASQVPAFDPSRQMGFSFVKSCSHCE